MEIDKEIGDFNNVYTSAHLESTAPSNSRIHTLLKQTWDILQYGHMLSHKMSLNKFKRIEIIQRMFTNYYGMKSEIIKGRKFEKSQICGN